MKRGIDIIRALYPENRKMSLNERLLNTIWDYENRQAEKIAQMQRDLIADIALLDSIRYHFKNLSMAHGEGNENLCRL